MTLPDQLLALFQQLKAIKPILVRIEQASPDLMQSMQRHLRSPERELTPVERLAGTPIYLNTALPLGTVRLVWSDGTWRDMAVPLFSDPFKPKAKPERAP